MRVVALPTETWHLFFIMSCLFLFEIKAQTSLNELATLTRNAYPQVIGHAGSSGYVPESTLASYDLAARLNTDYSEPDLILTQDGQFIAMHDLTLEGTTNIEDFPEYIDRKSTFVIEGIALSGYYAINFTLAEIKRLRVRQRFDDRSKLYDWLLEVPTLDEIIQWQLSYFKLSNRLVGLYPELKHPDWYNSMGYPMEDIFLKKIILSGYSVTGDLTPRDLSKVVPIVIQCFKSESLKYIATKTNIPLVQLIGVSNEYPTPNLVYNERILDEIMTYATAVAPDKKIFTTDWGTSVSKALEMRRWAFERNLFFIPWSFQLEQNYIPTQFAGDSHLELLFYYGCLQSSAIFHEFPDQARDVIQTCRTESNSTSLHTCLSLCPF